MVPLLADWCLVTVLDENGRRRDVGRAHRDPAMVETMNRYADLRASGNSATAPVPRLLRDVQPVVIAELTPELVVAMVSDPEGRRAVEPLRPSAVAAFPLVARDELFGGITLINGPERGHTPRPSSGAYARVCESSSITVVSGPMRSSSASRPTPMLPPTT